MASTGRSTVRMARSPGDHVAFTIATLILFLLLLLAGAGQARAFLGAGPQWYWLNPQPQGANLYDVDFADAAHGWAVGDCGTIIATADGGLTWMKQPAGTAARLDGVAFPTSSFGVAVGEDGAIVRTTDGGLHWQACPSGTTKSLNDVAFATTSRGWAVGEGLILTTVDGGDTWTPQTSPSIYDLYRVTCVDATRAWISGGYGYILRTSNAGATWEEYQSSSTSDDFRAVTFTDALNGWASDNWGTVYVSSDGGQSWQDDSPGSWMQGVQGLVSDGDRLWLAAADGTVWSRPLSGGGWAEQTSSTTADLYGLTTRGAGQVVAVGEGGTMVSTADSGTTWAPLSRGPEAHFQDVTFVDAMHGWAVGSVQNVSDSAIYVTADGGVTWARQTADDVNWFGGVAFDDLTHGWAVGWAGAIYATADGGLSWNRQVAGAYPNTSYMAVACTDMQHAWAVGWPDSDTFRNMRATTDGGTTWSPVDVGTNARLNDICFADSTHGWAVGYGGTVVATSDGATWQPQTTGVSGDLESVFFIDVLRGWAVGYDGTIITTSDGGTTWMPQSGGESDILKEVLFADASRGWIIDQSGQILATSDGGAHWTRGEARTTVLNAGFLVDATHAWAVGDWGTTLALDDEAPLSSATRSPAPNTAGWSKSPVTVTLSAADDRSGVVRSEYRLAAAADWTAYTGPFTVSAQGSSICEYRSVDAAGNVETAKSTTLSIDTTRPVTRALARATVRRGRKAILRLRVKDAVSPKATVTVKIYRRGVLKKTLRLGLRRTNRDIRYAGYTCRLRRGTYVWKVYATDLGGNAQRKPVGLQRLTVR